MTVPPLPEARAAMGLARGDTAGYLEITGER
jgi:hypothetical protein